MKPVFLAVLLCTGFAFAQNSDQMSSDKHKDQVTLQGCVGRSNGDYVLIKPNAQVTYQLQATGDIRFKDYLGQRVEVTGEKGPSMSTSSDAMNKTGSASAEMITVRKITTVAARCTEP